MVVGGGEYEWRMGGERGDTAGRRNGDCGYCYACYGYTITTAARQGEGKYRIIIRPRYIEIPGIMLSYNYQYDSHHYHCH